MADDDLIKPLGRNKKARGSLALPPILPRVVAGLLVFSLVAFGLWAATITDPMGGEPTVLIAVGGDKPAIKTAERSSQPAGKTETPSRYDGPAPGSKTITIIDGSSGKREEVTIPSTPASTTPANENALAPPNPKLQETSRHGAIPKVGPDGARPAEAYARPVKVAAAGKADGPRIAIVVGGLGIGASGTTDALTKLPGTVTFAFAPYGVNVDQLASRARNDGHEVMLQVPMEPFDYPDNDPGPQTLLTTLDGGQNVDRLHWLMSRFQGYVGISNYMGARFTASEPALSPILRETARRGLIYLDDGTSTRSVAGQIAGASKLAFAKADVVIDAVPTAAEVDRALARLEAAARERGNAIGVAGALPIVVDRIAKWAKAAEGRGVTLVPITAVINKQKSS